MQYNVIQGFQDGLEKIAKKNKRGNSVHTGAVVGGATALGTAGTALNIRRRTLAEEALESKLKKSHTKNDFMKKLKPGDILYSGYHPKHSPYVNIGKRKVPIPQSQVVQMVTGSPYYHGMLYAGKGKIIQAEGAKRPLAVRNLKSAMADQRVKAYRIKNLKGKDAEEAIRWARSKVGTPYKSVSDSIKQGLSMLYDPKGGPSSCRKTGKGIVCNTLPTKALNKYFKKEYSTIRDIRKNKNVAHIATFARSKIPRSDKIVSHVVYPALKSLKYAPLIAGGSYLAKKIYDRYKKGRR